jgi:hypothetical protein
MKLAKADLISALQLRYDHYSAQTMFDAARERAGLADLPAYEAAEVVAFRTALAAVGDRLTKVEDRIALLLAESNKPAPGTSATTATPTPATELAKPVAKRDAKKPAGDSAEATIETTITLMGVDAGDGEQVMMCGNVGALGDWDPERACPMSRNGDRWLATLQLASSGDVAFKFLRRAADGTVVWENGGDRNLVSAPRLDATWR